MERAETTYAQCPECENEGPHVVMDDELECGGWLRDVPQPVRRGAGMTTPTPPTPGDVRAALADLVRLKDGPRDDAYRAEKDVAWQRARDALTTPGDEPKVPVMDQEAVRQVIREEVDRLASLCPHGAVLCSVCITEAIAWESKR